MPSCTHVAVGLKDFKCLLSPGTPLQERRRRPRTHSRRALRTVPICIRRKAANRCTVLRRKAVTTDRLKGMPPATVGSCSSFAFSHHLTCSEIISCAQRASCGRVCLECQSFLRRNPLLAYKGKLLKATPAEIGMAGSLFGVTQLITAPLIGRSNNRSTYPCTWLASAILFGRLRSP